jgi:NAD(P)H-quinone oxidoreductase subunit 5
MFNLASVPLLAAAAALLAPIVLLAACLVPASTARCNGRTLAEWTARLASFSLLLALLSAAGVAIGGACHHRLIGLGSLGISLHLDSLSAIMLVLVAFLGAVITRYSVNYLDGDPRHGRFAQGLAATVSCVLLLVLSGNLAQFALAWIATSLTLHKLLTFYPDRKLAIAAARKKFLVSRLAEACVIAATFLIWHRFGTLEFDQLFAKASSLAGTASPNVSGIAFLLVTAALLKSAQFPFHSWLPETLEAPTPVSALMHAGIINAGGFLIIRLSPLVSLAPAALNLLAIVGTVSAVLASLVMMTQTSIKRSLAWSTVSQMGFMMLQCGLGAFALAVLHIVAHSLYKSYAFLSSGSILAITKAAWTPSGRPSSHPALLAFILSVAVSLTLTVGHFFGVHFSTDPGLLVLASVFIMALAFMLWNLWSTRFPSRLASWGVLAAALIACIWFAAHQGALSILGNALPAYQPVRSHAELALMAGVVLLFMTVLLFQACLPALATRPAFRRLYIHASNGFYLGTLAHRLLSLRNS